MQHSISQIGRERETLSKSRNEAPYFSAKGFVSFAKMHRDKYSVSEVEGELYVGSWHVDALIKDYKETLDVASGKKKLKENTVWVCNQCNSHQYTGSVSESDLQRLSCSECGGEEFHKENVSVNVETLPTEEQVLQTIFNHVDIRGIDLEDYKRNFSNEQSGLYDALVKLFKNN